MRYFAIFLVVCGCSNRAENLIPPAELERLPNVHAVDVRPVRNDWGQIIHILNWHYVTREDFEADGGQNWYAFLDSVEAVQKQQVELLRVLRDSYGVSVVFVEGLTEADMDGFRKLVKDVTEWKDAGGDDAMSEFLREMHREDVLRLGAAARVEGITFMPLENAYTLERANPVKDGVVQYDEAANRDREDAMVVTMFGPMRTSKPPVVAVLLGGAHDLGDNMVPSVEYVRVQVQAHYDAVAE